MSCEGLRQGNAPVSVYFNVLMARVCKKHIVTLAGRGVLFAIVDVLKILAPPVVIAKLAEGLPALAWSEAGLKTQSVNNRLYVQPSAQLGWNHYLSTTPRGSSTDLPVHDIPDGSESFATRRTPSAEEFGRRMTGSTYWGHHWDPLGFRIST
jgi:hypothetical protein